MNNIVTRRSLLNFYLVLLFGFVFFFAMGAAMIFPVLDPEQRKDISRGGEYVMVIFGAIVIYLAFYSVYRYYKNAPIVQVDEHRICFGNSIFYWRDVSKIELTGKQPFRYIVKYPMEGAKFTMNDGQVKYIFDDVYANSWQLKSFIQEVVLNKSAVFQLPLTAISRTEFEHDSFETYSGNQFTSLRGISFWSFIVMGIFACFEVDPESHGLFVFIFSYLLLWFVVHSRLMHYFKVSQNFIVVKNHLAFWKSTGHRLENINEVVFETQGKMPNCLRIIFKDFRNKIYPAGTLRDSTWLLMKDKLESHGISVRNECI